MVGGLANGALVDLAEEIVAFVIDEDESGEIFHFDLPNGFHPKLWEIEHFDLADMILS